MNKIQENIFITADQIRINEKGKIICIKGSFYFNGKTYKIENEEIKGE